VVDLFTSAHLETFDNEADKLLYIPFFLTKLTVVSIPQLFVGLGDVFVCLNCHTAALTRASCICQGSNSRYSLDLSMIGHGCAWLVTARILLHMLW
jgi:hypothetical protein